jgi:hypothetical protein
MSLIGSWDYYTSVQVDVPNTTAQTNVFSVDSSGNPTGSKQAEGLAAAYIYGYMPGTENWEPNSCVAYVFVKAPTVQIIGTACQVTIIVTVKGNINFQATQTKEIED